LFKAQIPLAQVFRGILKGFLLVTLCVIGLHVLAFGQSSPSLKALEHAVFKKINRQPMEVYGPTWQLVAQARVEHDFIIESKAHVYLSSIWNWRNDLDSARYHAQRSVDAALRSGDENIISNAYNMLGNAFESLGQLDSAFVSYETSLRHGELSGQPKNTSRALLNLGMIHRTRGEYASALERLTQAKVLCLKYNLKPYRANLYLSIGEVYLQIGDHAAAFENLQTALRSAKANRFPRVAARALMALGDIAWSTQDSAEAICWYTASRDAAREAEIPSIEGQASALMATILMAQGEPETAREAATAALHISERDHDTITLGRACYALGQLDMHAARYASAQRWCEKAYGLASQASQTSAKLDACDCIWRSAEQGGHWQAAFYYHRIYEQLQDSLLNQENTLAIARQEAKIGYDQRHRADSLLQAATDQQKDIVHRQALAMEQVRTRNTLWVGLTIGLLAVLALLALLLFRRQNRRLRSQNDQIQAQNAAIKASLQEKQVLLQEVHHRVKNNLQVMVSLLEMQATKVEDPAAIEALLASKGRVQAMTLIHQKLFQQDNIAALDFGHYLRELVTAIGSLHPEGRHIVTTFGLDDCRFGIDTAVPLGLMLNELVTNAYKYAFAGRESGHLWLGLQQVDPIAYELVVEDDGNGLPQDFDMATVDSLGLHLVEGLARQLRGQLTMGVSRWGGARFVVRFKSQKL
jgi:two-component system, sensor histidine kinase PdtaS